MDPVFLKISFQFEPDGGLGPLQNVQNVKQKNKHPS